MGLIDRQAALDTLNEIKITRGASWYEFYQKALTAVGELPPVQLTVDAVPVKHGRWKAVKDGEDDYRRICSCCGEDAPYDEADDCYLIYPHCPWCGTKMDGKDGDN